MLLAEIQNQMHFLKEVTDAVKWQGGFEVLYALFEEGHFYVLFLSCFIDMGSVRLSYSRFGWERADPAIW